MFKTTRFKSPFYFLKLRAKSKSDKQIETEGVIQIDIITCLYVWHKIKNAPIGTHTGQTFPACVVNILKEERIKYVHILDIKRKSIR